MTADDKKQLIRKRAERISNLKKSPDFQEWAEETRRRVERDRKRLITDYLTIGDPVDQRVVDYMRGFWDALEYATKLPDKAEDTFLRALRQSETLKEGNG